MVNNFLSIRATSKKTSGFTLIELVIAMGIILLLFGFLGISLVKNQKIASVNSARDTLISDLTSQQTKAMNGSGGVTGTNFGIHLLSDSYVLFKGNSYDSNDSSNFSVDLDPGINFLNVYFSNDSIIFASGSGEIIGFQSGQNTFQIQDNSGKVDTITINKYGIVTSD